jgi:hypothetical protein
VNALMNLFEERFHIRLENASTTIFTNQTTQRRIGEELLVIDPGSLPVAPASPPRAAISLAGMGIGLLIGVIRLWRRPGAVILQAA